MPLEAIEPRRLYRQIADQIRQLIDRGEYPVGGRLPAERELADMRGVSRPTVREALIALEVEGRLRIKVGSGIYVNAPPASEQEAHAGTIEGPFEVLRARAFVESAVAEEAARKAEPPASAATTPGVCLFLAPVITRPAPQVPARSPCRRPRTSRRRPCPRPDDAARGSST